jgi:hypothetical protein
MIDGKGRLMARAFQHMRGTSGKVAEGRTIMGTEGVGRAIAVGKAASDAVEQALSKTSLAELVCGVG